MNNEKACGKLLSELMPAGKAEKVSEKKSRVKVASPFFFA
jgi:hypothetical protein